VLSFGPVNGAARRSARSLEAMNNCRATAERWTNFVASRSYVPKGQQLMAQFSRGTITHICDCGCNSFELRVLPDSSLDPLVTPSTHGGSVLELAFYTSVQAEPRRTVEINIHVDARGYFSGLDVDFCANSAAMPDEVALDEPPFHLHGTLVNGL
jgi:hypothetical protein